MTFGLQLLANPIFLLIAVITAIVAAVVYFAYTIDIQKAMALSNLYGRVNSIAIAQLRYAAQTKQTVEIDFFQKDVKKYDHT